MNRKYKLKEKIRDLLGILSFFLLIIGFILYQDCQIKKIENQQKSATEVATHIAQTN